MMEWITSSSAKVVIISTFLGGVLLGYGLKRPAAPVVEDATKQDSKVSETHTVIKKPDGTTITRVKKEQEHAKESLPIAEPALKRERYALGVEYLPSLSELPSSRDVRIHGGVRLGDTPFYGTGGYDVKNHQFSLGIEYTW